MTSERRTAVITGASAGIGYAVAEAMARRGWRLGLGARREDRLDAAAARMRELGTEVYAGALDITDAASIDRFFDRCEEQLGVADVIVNNAGASRPSAFQEYSIEWIQTEIATNLLGPILVTRRALQSLLADGRGGDVIFMGSDAALHPRPEQVLYGATKAGIENLANGLARELEGSGVRVTKIRIGPTLTEFGAEWNLDDFEERRQLWERHGLRDARLFGDLLDADAVAQAVLDAVTRPAGVWIDTIEIQPAAPARRHPPQ